MTAQVPERWLQMGGQSYARAVHDLPASDLALEVAADVLTPVLADLREQVQTLFHPVGRTIEEDAYNDAVRDVLALLDGGES